MIRRILLAILLLGGAASASAQSVQQSGSVTTGHLSSWATSGVLQDAGTATAGKVNSLGLYGNGGTPWCITRSTSPGPFSGAYSQLCAGISTTGAYLNIGNYGGDPTTPFQVIQNGSVIFQTSSTGTNLPLTSGYLFVGNASNLSVGVPLTGDCTITNVGVITCSSTNGTAFGALATAGYDTNFTIASSKLAFANIASGNVLGNNTAGSNEPTSATLTSLLDRNFSSTQGSVLIRSNAGWAALGPGVSGQVFQTQGGGANPAWATITGTGTVTSIATNNGVTGGTITSSGTIGLANIGGGQVLANATSSSGLPMGTSAPVLGVNAATAGTVGLANGGGSGATVTVQNPSATTAYNFNLPATAGTTGQYLTSAGGGSSPTTWTTPPAALDIPVRQTVLSGDTTSGAASFMTTGSGLAPAFTAANPLVMTFANGFGVNGAVDSVTSLSSGGTTAAIPANALSYISATYATGTSVTWGSSLAPKQEGPTYNQAAQSSLTLNNVATDDFGNAWTNNGVTFTNSSPMLTGTYMGVFNGSSSNMKSVAFSSLSIAGQSGAFALRGWFKTGTLAAMQGLFSAANTSNGYGLWLQLNTSGKLVLSLSSTGSSFDISNQVVGSTTLSAGTAYFVELTYDPVAGKFFVYVNGIADATLTTTSTLRTSAFNSGLIVGAIQSTSLQNFWNGNIQGFEFLPYCQHPAGATYSVPTSLASISAAGYASSWWDSTNKVMKTPSVASTVAGANPTFTTSQTLYVGEATAGASSISSVSSYAFQGEYASPWTVGLPSAMVSATHNLGTLEYNVLIEVMNVTADQGWSPGERSDELQSSNGTYGSPRPGIRKNRNSASLAAPNAIANWQLGNATTGTTGVTLTPANWAYRITASRKKGY